MDKSLNELVADYKQYGGDRSAIVEEIAQRVYREPRRYGFHGLEEAADAVYQFRARLEKMIDRYVDMGPPFEAYLSRSLSYMAKSIHRQQQECRLRFSVCERSERLSFETHDRDLPAGTLGLGFSDFGGGKIPQRFPLDFGLPEPSTPSEAAAMKKRLLFLYLKCAWNSNDRDTARVARVIQVSPDWLAAMLGQALRYLEPERRRYEYILSRRDRSWARICLLEEKLQDGPDPYQRADFERSLEAERLRFRHALFDLKRFRPLVPNSVIAQLLSVPKGTVDSGLYYLRLSRESQIDKAQTEAPAPNGCAGERPGRRRLLGLS